MIVMLAKKEIIFSEQRSSTPENALKQL